MYRSGSRSSVSSHRPKDGGDGGLRLARGSGSSSGALRRPSPPSCSSSSSSRPPARRHRSPSGHRGRRASPSPSPPPRSRRYSPSPPRGRRVSRSPSWSRRGSPSPPPRSRRLYPPGPSGFRGSGRGDGRGDHLGDGGIRRQSPGMCSDSLEQSLRITVGNDHFCIGTPERRRLSDHLGSPVDNLEDMDRDDLTDDSVFTRSSQCSRGLQHYISQEEGPLSPLGQREDYRTRETFQHQSEYSPHISCHDELLWGAEQSRDRLKGSYSIRSEERSREAKRPRYDDTEKIHSMGGDRPSFLSGTHNYRQHRQSPSHRFLDPEFRELDLARRKREEEEERNRSLSQELLGVDNGGTSCSIPGLSGVLATPEPGYALHRPKEVPVMPKKSILKKRIEVNMKPSMQLESFSSSTSSSQNRPLYSDHSSLQLSGAIAAFASEAENKGNTVETAPKEPQRNPYHWGALPEMPKDSNPLREQFGSFLCCKENLDSKAEGLERHGDFLLPHERVSQDGSGFSQILSVLADPTSAQEKRQCSFPDIEDEEKFLYGDEEEDLRAESPPQSLGDPESEVRRQEASSLPSVAAATQLESQEETNPEYAKIHDLLKTIGLDIGVVEISKLAARTQERLHGKKPSSRSSADHRSSVDQQFSTDSCSSIDPCFSADQCASDPHRLESRELHYSNARSLEMSHAHPASPVDRYLLRKNSSPFLKSDHPVGHISRSEVAGSGFHSSVAVRCRLPPVPSPVRLPYPASLSQFHMPRASQFATARIPPNYQRSPIPSASFEAYRHYMAYAVSRWPLYPAPQPSNHPLPESHKTSASKNVTHSRPNLRVVPIKGNAPQKKKTTKGSVPATQVPAQVPIPKGSVPAAQVPIPKGSVPAAQVPIPKGSVPAAQVPILKGSVPAAQVPAQVPIPKGSVPAAQVPNPPPMKCNPEKISDEKNRATQKQKVIEEREKLKSDQEARQKKMFYLKTELERLHKQQGEMLRKKRREKDGHKDPLLLEVSRLQDNITKDIAQLQQEVEEAEKKQSELDKVAQILGINISDKSVKSSSDSKEPMEKPENDEKPKSPESALALSNSSSDNQESKVNNEKSHIKSLKPAESPQPSTQQSDQPVATYEYYDAGSHWCKDCNAICGTMFDFFTHMHNKKHTQTLDPYNRPWASKTQSESKQDAEKRTDKITVPAKGSEFLIPITGFYCQLCEEFLGDSISGEQHVKGHQHNEKYKKYVEENPLYEDRRNLDHQAGLAVVLETERRRQIELKRKLSEKPKEEKKEKRAKVTKESKEDDKLSVELENQHIEDGNSPEKAENKRNASIKLQVKEEIKKESPVACFGKFSWKKPEKEEKSSLVAPSLPKEENVENSKDKEDLKAEAGKAKPIKIKLSGKTVVAHTSPWVPVVRTSPQTKIRPNLPIPPTVLRKPCSVTVSKPAPLNTFLSIKSSGTPAKPLPVVKESSTDLLLPPDIISKAFGGEEVVLKGSPEEKAALAEKNEPSQITEQILAPPPPPPPPPPPVTHPAVPSSAPAKKSVSVIPQPLSPGFQGPNILNPVLPVAFVASEQPVAIPSDETAPGVSENDQDQTPFSMLVRPPPPLSSVFSEQAKKLEKRNSCLATANAKDLYDIFYSSGGKGAPETKLGGGTLANGESSSFSKTECTDTSSSTLNSTVFQGEMPKGRGLVTAIVSNSKQPTEKWSVLEHVNPKSKNSSYGFLQPLTRLCQNKPYETIPPKADVWASNSFHSDSTRDRPPEGRTDFGQGKPEPPGVDLAHLSDTNCHAKESQLVRINLIDSDNQGKKSQELYQSTDCKESEIKNIEPKGKVAIVEGTSANVSPHNIEDFNLSHGNRDVGEEREQPTLPMTDTKAEQSGKLLTGHENLSTVVIELSTQSFSSSKVKIDSFPSEARSFLQNPQDMPEKMSTAELLKSPARSSICLTDSPQQKGVSAGSEKEVENSVLESASKTARCRSLKLKKNVSMMCEPADWEENQKTPETWESPKRVEMETLELQDISPEQAVTVESKALGDFEASHLRVEELADLGDVHVGFCNALEPALGSSDALSQKVCEENSVLPTPSDFEPVPSFSGFRLDSPKTLVFNLETEDKHNSSNLRNGRLTSKHLKAGLSVENVDHGLEGLEGAHQALDLLAGGMLPEEVTEASKLQKEELFRLEPETMNPSSLGPSPCLPDLVDFVTRTSGVPKENPYSPLYEPGDLPRCGSLEMSSLQLEILNVSIPDVSVPQVNEDNGSVLDLVKTPTSGSPLREQVVGGNMGPQEMPEQEAEVDVIRDHIGSSGHD